MHLERLPSSSAFVLFDLPEAPTSVGPVRLAPKVLPSSSQDLARAVTYRHALVGQQIGGAAAGIDAPAAERASAIDSFVEAVRPLVASGRFLPDPARGVAEADLAPLRGEDPRSSDWFAPAERAVTPHDRAVAAGAAGALRALGPIDGRTVAVDGLGGVAIAFAEAVAAAGARIVAVAGSGATVHDPDGIDVTALRDAATAADTGELGPATEVPVEALGADVLATSAGVGAYDHERAVDVTARVLVPLAPLVLTARALAVLTRAGAVVLPDFLTLAGDALAVTAPALDEAGATAIGTRVREIAEELAPAPDGWFLAAAGRAEAYLRTWCDSLPFGRPLAP